MKDDKNIPALRFPEFREEGEWKKKRLGEALDSESSQIALNKIEFKPKGYPLYGADGFLGFIDFYQQEEDFIAIVKDGSGVGRLFHCGEKSSVLGTLTYLKAKDKGKFILNWLYYLLNTVDFSVYVKGGGIPHIYFSDYQKEKVLIPSNKEQQKIAGCLSSLDEVIELEIEKLTALQQHKKGLMQKLFPAEGQKVPELRFSEFKDSGDWKEKKLGEAYKFIPTNSFSRDKLNYKKGKVKNIHYGDIHTKFSVLFDIEKEDVPFINSEIPIDKIKEDNYCKEGDLIFADASEDVDDVGKSIEIVNLNEEKLLSGLHTLSARQVKDNLIVGFAGHLFTSNWIRRQIQRESQGAKVLGISASRISKVKIQFPENKLEQQKIAKCLSSIDELITAQAEKIEQLKRHKKGLMQQMFPNT